MLAVAAVTATGALLPAEARNYGNSYTRQRAVERQKLVIPAGPLVTVISLREQRLSLYGRDGLISTSTVSTGTPGHLTPTGVFSVLEKHREHYSNIYGGASMPHMQRITWSGVAMHAGHVTGRPASHGCIRLPASFALDLFGITKIGMRVIVAPSNVAPQDIQHSALFVPRRLIAEEGPAPAVRPAEATRVASLTNDGARNLQTDGAMIVAEAGVADQATRDAAGADAAQRAKDMLAARREAGEKAKFATKAADAMRRSAAPQLAEMARLAKVVQAAEKQLRSDERQLAAQYRAHESATNENARDRLARAVAAAEDRVNSARARLDAAAEQEGDRRQANAAILGEAKAAEDQKLAAIETYRELVRRGEPISVFISAKTGLLQIRQAFDPIFEMPVTIRDRELRPLGTHVFTAIDVKEAAGGGDNGQVRWTVVSIPNDTAVREPERRDSRSPGGGG